LPSHSFVYHLGAIVVVEEEGGTHVVPSTVVR
jgi:hypothetical protein